MKLLLDTCVWIWDRTERKRLSPAARRAIDAAARRDELHLAVISCWEVAKLVEKGRLRLSLPVRDWVEAALARSGLSVIPLSPAIAVESTELPGGFAGDPADQIIVATARRHGLTIVTPDRRMRDYGSARTVW